MLLGVQAVIAESFERIHRANLVGMGILPLAFLPGQGWRQLGLTGSERYVFHDVKQSIRKGDPINVTAHGQNGDIDFQVLPQVLTEAERALLAAGGIPTSVLRAFTQEKEHLHAPQSEN
jgi:aconitate hydratase